MGVTQCDLNVRVARVVRCHFRAIENIFDCRWLKKDTIINVATEANQLFSSCTDCVACSFCFNETLRLHADFYHTFVQKGQFFFIYDKSEALVMIIRSQYCRFHKIRLTLKITYANQSLRIHVSQLKRCEVKWVGCLTSQWIFQSYEYMWRHIRREYRLQMYCRIFVRIRNRCYRSYWWRFVACYDFSVHVGIFVRGLRLIFSIFHQHK